HLDTAGTRGVRRNQFFTRVRLEEGDNSIAVEMTNRYQGNWKFNLDISTVDYVRYYALEPDYYNSCKNPTVAFTDSLNLHVTNPEFIPTTQPSLLEIYDLNGDTVISERFLLKNGAKIAINALPQSVYSYRLY